MKITRTTMELDTLFSDKEMQERYFTNAYWLPTLPDVEGTYERYLKTIEKSREWKGEEYGHLVIASERLKTIDGEMLLFSFPVEELYAKMGLIDGNGAIGIFTITPSEAAIIAAIMAFYETEKPYCGFTVKRIKRIG